MVHHWEEHECPDCGGHFLIGYGDCGPLEAVSHLCLVAREWRTLPRGDSLCLA